MSYRPINPHGKDFYPAQNRPQFSPYYDDSVRGRSQSTQPSMLANRAPLPFQQSSHINAPMQKGHQHSDQHVMSPSNMQSPTPQQFPPNYCSVSGDNQQARSLQTPNSTGSPQLFQQMPSFPVLRNIPPGATTNFIPPNYLPQPPAIFTPPPFKLQQPVVYNEQFVNAQQSASLQLFQSFQSILTQTNFPKQNYGANFNRFQSPLLAPSSNSDSTSSEAKDDQWFIKWEAEKMEKHNKTLNVLKIHEMKDVISSYCNQLQVLYRYHQYMDKNANELGDDEWQQIATKMDNMNEGLQKIAGTQMREESVRATSALLKRRHSKRKNRCLKTAKRAEIAIKEQEQREKREQEIDEWRSKVLAETQFKQMVESMKNDAGDTLTQVKKKINEMTKINEFVDNLNSLRSIRRETSLKRGIFVLPEQDQRFHNQMKHVSDIITTQLHTYQKEDIALRVLMEEEKEDIEKQEREKQRIAREKKQSGHDILVSNCRRYWQQADDNVGALIRIRGLWDTFLNPLVPGSTAMPSDWVMPCLPSSVAWKKYLKKIATEEVSQVDSQ